MVVKATKWPLLDALFEHYIAHQDEYVAHYNGKHVLLHDLQVVGAFPTSGDAYDFAIERFVPGEFMIQKCSLGDREYVARVFTPNRFVQ